MVWRMRLVRCWQNRRAVSTILSRSLCLQCTSKTSEMHLLGATSVAVGLAAAGCTATAIFPAEAASRSYDWPSVTDDYAFGHQLGAGSFGRVFRVVCDGLALAAKRMASSREEQTERAVVERHLRSAWPVVASSGPLALHASTAGA